MIKFENTEVMGWEAAIRGMRNPMNSWEKSDSGKIYWNGTWYTPDPVLRSYFTDYGMNLLIGPNDHYLMMRLAAGGPVHAKYRRMITVYVDITAPLYWWKEFDTYKVGTVVNSCSTMHKIADKEFTLEDFSCERMIHAARIDLGHTIDALNFFRRLYLHGGMAKDEDGNLCGYGEKSKEIWWQMIQLLPSSYNQKRTVMLNYEVLAHIYKDRKYHMLDEWAEHDPMVIGIDTDEGSCSLMGFCDWIKTLPYPELICGEHINKEETSPSCSLPMSESK